MSDLELLPIYQLQEQGKFHEAIALLEEIIAKNPTSDAFHQLGLCFAQIQDITKSITFLEKALELDSNNAVVHNHLGNVFKIMKQTDKAIQHYLQAIAITPDYAQAHSNLASLYALRKDYQHALKHYHSAVHAAPDFVLAHFNLGLLLLQNNQKEAASVQFQNVLSLCPDHIESQFYRAALALDCEDLETAEFLFEQVLSVNEQDLDTLNNLGVIALKRKQGQKAIEYFTKVLTYDINHQEARNNLAATFMHHDRFENALMHYDVLLKNDPNNIEYLYNMGVAQMALGHLNEAVLLFETLLEHDEKHFASLNNLAAIYNRLGDKTKAQSLLEKALASNPGDKSSQHMLNALKKTGSACPTSPEYATNLFNNYALYYDKHMQEQLHYRLPQEIQHLLSELPQHQFTKVLDLGCGTGLMGEMIKPYCKELTGVDIAEKMIQRASEKQVYDQLVTADLQTFLQNNNESFDLVIAADVLPYLGALDKVFSAITDHLTQSGYFIFTTEISEDGEWQLQENARFSHKLSYLQDLAEKSGLKWFLHKEIVARHQEDKPVSVYLVVCQRG